MKIKSSCDMFSGLRFGYSDGSVYTFKIRLVALISIFAIYIAPLFFALSALVGFEYGGKGESSVYVYYVVFFLMAILIVYLRSFAKKSTMCKTEIGFYFFFLFLIINHLTWVMVDSKTSLWNDNLIFFVTMGITGFLAARTVQAFDAWKEIIRLTEVVVILASLGLIIAIVQPYFLGYRMLGIAGASYQAASYYAAMCFGLLGVATFRLERAYRYSFFHLRFLNAVNVALMIGLFIAAMLNGGRGAFILIVLYALLVIYWFVKRKGMTYRALFRFAALTIVVPVLLHLGYQKIHKDYFLSAGFNRMIAFIGSPDGGLIDLEGGSSGRDRVYAVALDAISESPLLGYGAFAHWDKVIPPHNIFLDLSLQFGVPAAVILAFIIVVSILMRLKPVSTEKVWLLNVSLYPLVNLMFSAGYLTSSVFWFGLAGFLFVGSRNRTL